MEYLRGYQSFWRDQQWVVKLAWASLWLLIANFVPVITQAIVMGWMAMSMRHAVLARSTDELPSFDFDIDYIVQLMLAGLKQFVVLFAWFLPIGIIVALLTFPLLFLASASATGDEPSSAAMMCIMIALVPIVIIVAIPSQVALMRVELCDSIASGFAIGPILSFTRVMLFELIFGLFLVGLVGMFVALLGLFALCIGVFPATVVINYAMAQCRAYLYQRYIEKGGEPWPVAKPIDGAYPTAGSYRDPAVFA